MLRNKLKNHKTIISNTFFLSIIQFVNVLVPVLALPYVIKIIGTDLYGEIAFVQSITAYFFILINFGLDISAIKDVSQNRSDKAKLSEIVSAVFAVKTVLFITSALLFSIMILVVPSFRANSVLFFVVFSGSIAEVLFPSWYYQGIERMAMISIVKFISVGFYLSTLFFVVKQSSDYLFVPMLQVGGSLLSALVGLFMIIKIERVVLQIPLLRHMITTFKDSIPFFMSRVSFVINSNIAQTLSGIFLGMSEVAAFDIAKKIINFAFIPLQMLMQAVFPHNANKQDKLFVKKFLYVLAGVTLIGLVFVYLLAPFIVHFFAGNALSDAVFIIRILCLYIFFGAFSNYLGSPVLVAFGYSKAFNRSVYLSTIALLFCYGIFYLFNALSLTSFAVALVVSEAVIMIYRYFYCVKFKIL